MYYMKHFDETIALVNNSLEIIEVFNQAKLPLRLRKGSALNGWIESRTIDDNRYSSRTIKKLLGSEYSILSNRLLSITDNWWLTADETEKYSKNYNNGLAEITIQGLRSGTPVIDLSKDYCELGTTGSFEKCWKKLNGDWYLFKSNNSLEEFSEIYSSTLLRELGFNVVKCSVVKLKTELGLINSYTVSKDFTENGKYDYEPFFSVFNDNEDEDFIINGLKSDIIINHCSESITPDNLIRQYYEIIVTDALINNPDRHNLNIGLLRDSVTGSIIGLAPNFDLNLSLVARTSYSNAMMLQLKRNLNTIKIEILRKIKDNLHECLYKTEIKLKELYSSVDFKMLNHSINTTITSLDF